MQQPPRNPNQPPPAWGWNDQFYNDQTQAQPISQQPYPPYPQPSYHEPPPVPPPPFPPRPTKKRGRVGWCLVIGVAAALVILACIGTTALAGQIGQKPATVQPTETTLVQATTFATFADPTPVATEVPQASPTPTLVPTPIPTQPKPTPNPTCEAVNNNPWCYNFDRTNGKLI